MLRMPAFRWLAGTAVLLGAMALILVSHAPKGALRPLTASEEHRLEQRKAERRERYTRRRKGEEKKVVILHPAPEIDPAELVQTSVRPWSAAVSEATPEAQPVRTGPETGSPPLADAATATGSESPASVAPEPAGTFLEGRVTQLDGQPAAGLALRLRSIPGGRVEVSGRSDPDGHYLLTGVPRGRFRVEFGPEDQPLRPPSGVATEVEIGMGRNQLDLRAPRLGSLEIEVVDAEGRPLPAAELRVRERFGTERRGRTDGEGRLRLEHLPVGSWRIALFQDGLRTAEAQAAVVAGGLGRVRLQPRPRP